MIAMLSRSSAAHRARSLLLAGGFLAAVAHVAPVAERAALGISHGDFIRVEDLAPEAIARPLGEVRAAVRLSRRLESQSAPGTLPNPALTPGAVRTTDRDEVYTDRHTKQYRHWSRAQADRILKEYGLPPGPYGREHEIDHLIPLDLGGADDDANLWPEPRRSIEPVWNAERKDRLEWHMADLVCSGQLDLPVAQEAIRANWIEAYERYVGEA